MMSWDRPRGRPLRASPRSVRFGVPEANRHFRRFRSSARRFVTRTESRPPPRWRLCLFSAQVIKSSARIHAPLIPPGLPAACFCGRTAAAGTASNREPGGSVIPAESAFGNGPPRLEGWNQRRRHPCASQYDIAATEVRVHAGSRWRRHYRSLGPPPCRWRRLLLVPTRRQQQLQRLPQDGGPAPSLTRRGLQSRRSDGERSWSGREGTRYAPFSLSLDR
jgi:hypothetical protein